MRPPPWDYEITAETVSLTVALWELRGLCRLKFIEGLWLHVHRRYSGMCSLVHVLSISIMIKDHDCVNGDASLVGHLTRSVAATCVHMAGETGTHGRWDRCSSQTRTHQSCCGISSLSGTCCRQPCGWLELQASAKVMRVASLTHWWKDIFLNYKTHSILIEDKKTAGLNCSSSQWPQDVYT